MGKNPAFQFYPTDWTRDLDDQDLEIEGAWIRIICRLWWSDTRGEATKPLKEWARILRKTEQKTIKIFQILFEKHIADGAFLDNQMVNLISRRMKRDHELSQLRYRVGIMGGNPALKKHGENLDNQNPNQNARSSSSSSSSSSIKKKSIKEKKILPPKNQFLDSVFLTTEEHEKLLAKYGQRTTDKAIEILNNGIMSKGYKYKSHYHTLLGWPMREAMEVSNAATPAPAGTYGQRNRGFGNQPQPLNEEAERELDKARVLSAERRARLAAQSANDPASPLPQGNNR